jgi:hypothetical protein
MIDCCDGVTLCDSAEGPRGEAFSIHIIRLVGCIADGGAHEALAYIRMCIGRILAQLWLQLGFS